MAATCALSATDRPLQERILIHFVRLSMQRGEFERVVDTLVRHVAKAPDIAWIDAAEGAAAWLIAYGRPELARRVLSLFPAGTEHRVASMRQLIARDLKEFLSADLTGIGTSTTGAVLNLLPLNRLIELAEDQSISVDYRVLVARAAFTRALLTEGVARAREVLRVLKPIDAEAAAYLKKFEEAWGEGRSWNLAALAIARMPGMNLNFGESRRSPKWNGAGLTEIDTYDHSDANWWCPFDEKYARATMVEGFFGRTIPRLDDASFVDVSRRMLADNPVLRLISDEELSKLSKVPSAPKFLAEQAVFWAKNSGFWSRLIGYERGLPELLALSVRASRYGCQRAGGHGAYSQAAFKQLHEKFPMSERAKQTRWWFDCENFRRGCVGPYSKADLDQLAWGRRR